MFKLIFSSFHEILECLTDKHLGTQFVSLRMHSVMLIIPDGATLRVDCVRLSDSCNWLLIFVGRWCQIGIEGSIPMTLPTF